MRGRRLRVVDHAAGPDGLRRNVSTLAPSCRGPGRVVAAGDAVPCRLGRSTRHRPRKYGGAPILAVAFQPERFTQLCRRPRGDAIRCRGERAQRRDVSRPGRQGGCRSDQKSNGSLGSAVAARTMAASRRSRSVHVAISPRTWRITVILRPIAPLCSQLIPFIALVGERAPAPGRRLARWR
jgi:hypothetical protein